MRLPPELASLLYVACTRVTKLENLFVSAIHPCVLCKIGQSDCDKHKRVVNEKLKSAAIEFARSHRLGKRMEEEKLHGKLTIQQTSKNGVICRCKLDLHSLLVDYNAFASYRRLSMIFMLTQAMFSFNVSRPVMSERHIGIDQGIKNFAIAVVERVIGHSPVIVHCQNHTDLQLKNCFKATDVLCALKRHTNLLFLDEPSIR